MIYMSSTASHSQKHFRALVEDHGDRIYNLALMRCNDLDLAKDISQETFLRAYKGISNFRNEAEVGTWLYRIALNVCHTVLARESNRSKLNVALEPEYFEASADDMSIEDDHLAGIQKEQIRKAILRLPRNQGDAITLYYLKEFQYSEVADIMAIPINTVKSHLRRAKQNLRGILKKEVSL